MRFETAGQLRKLDLEPLPGLVGALRDEWAGLRFDPGGPAVNPLTGAVVEAFALVRGRHRSPGAVYRVTITVAVSELPDDRRAAFDEEAAALVRRDAPQEQWSDHHDRRRAASVQVGTDQTIVDATLVEDRAGRLAFTVADESGHGTGEVVVGEGPLPAVTVDGRVDLTALLRAEQVPGCVTALFGGAGRAAAALDLAALDRGGRFVDASGRSRWFRGRGHLDLDSAATTWSVSGSADLRARGLGRPALWVAGAYLRRSVRRSLAELWASSDQWGAELEQDLARLRATVAREGGPEPFVRRWLWDEHFAPGIEILGRRGS